VSTLDPHPKYTYSRGIIGIRDVVALILEDLPQDPTLVEENLFAALFGSHIGEVIKRANEFDLWLAAHLADMMQPLGLLVESAE
jgi:nuclear pore complex protein Nup85